YSGHGAANPDTQINYLIPVDVADPNDSNLWYQSFQQNDLIDKLSKQAPNATHYVVFDACRNELNLSGPAALATMKSLCAGTAMLRTKQQRKASKALKSGRSPIVTTDLPSRPRWANSPLMRSASTMCTATCGIGPRIARTTTIKARPRMVRHGHRGI